MEPYRTELQGVPETMLWTLHNRASEAKRPNTYLIDPDCIRIYDSIDYDYKKSFGKPDGSHPLRSRIFDDVMVDWLGENPGGIVVELAAGLETQFQRIDDGRVRWFCVDVEESIQVRERFLPETNRCKYIRKSALDFTWMGEIPTGAPVFVSIQGLLMYFSEEDVKELVTRMVDYFPGVELLFDVIPGWFSRKTIAGFKKTESYTAPPMPWGINASEVERTFFSWSDKIAQVRVKPFGMNRGIYGILLGLFTRVESLRNILPAIVHIKTEPSISGA